MAAYKEAIQWIVENDDTGFIDDDGPLSVTAALVADLFDKPDKNVRYDISKALVAYYNRKKYGVGKSILSARDAKRDAKRKKMEAMLEQIEQAWSPEQRQQIRAGAEALERIAKSRTR